MKPSAAFVTALLAGLSAGLIAESLAGLYIYSRGGFGSGDLRGYAYWNLLFAAYFLALSLAAHRRLDIPSAGRRLAWWAAIGAALGFLWTWLVAFTVGPWILAFSFPVLYVWTVAGLAGGVLMARLPPPAIPLRWKRFWVVLLAPFGALVAALALTWGLTLGSRCLWDRAKPESFIFPDGFIGQAYLIVDAKDAGPAEVIEGRVSYNFDHSGIHRTSGPGDQGWLDERFFYRKPDGSTTRIATEWSSTIADNATTRHDTTTGIYFIQWGQRGPDSACSVRYMSFFVGRQADVLDNGGVDSLEAYLSAHPPCPRFARP